MYGIDTFEIKLNAKELILAKINAGTNFAKMYVYAMMVGLNLDDTVAFMTCPISELIDKLASPSIFENYGGSPDQAINMVQGIVGIKNRLHGTIEVATLDEYGEETTKTETKSTFIANRLKAKYPKLTADVKGLSQIMKTIINAAIEDSSIDLREAVTYKDMEIVNYIQECQDLINSLRQVRKQYGSIKEMNADIEEFKKLYDLSSEISTVSSAWLGLNQGIPTSKTDILKRLNRMSNIVFERENLLGINAETLYDEKTPTLETAISNIMSNNPRTIPTIEPISILEYTSATESSLPFGKRNDSLLIVNGFAIAKIINDIKSTYLGVNSFVIIGSMKGIIK